MATRPASILIVEDEAIVALDIRQMLGELGYEVVASTPTGEEAVILAQELKPSVVLMDIHLARKMDGIEAANRIRKQSGTPVVFLTAFADAETLERAKLSEPFGYLIKPFDARYLRTAIEIAIFKHGAESQLRQAYDEQATILRTALDAYFLSDSQGRILDVNDSSCRMLGYSREELLQMSLSDLDLADECPEVLSVDGDVERAPVLVERTQRCKGGRLARVEMSINHLPRSGGRSSGSRGTSRGDKGEGGRLLVRSGKGTARAMRARSRGMFAARSRSRCLTAEIPRSSSGALQRADAGRRLAGGGIPFVPGRPRRERHVADEVVGALPHLDEQIVGSRFRADGAIALP
ncbi:MAG: response regulator [Vicinamibacteria bacterium]